MSWTAFGQHAGLEGTYHQEMKTDGPATQRTLLVTWKVISSLGTQQTLAVQISHYSYMGLWR